MEKLPKGSYLNVQAWMINDLDLSGNELLLYALIFGFNQDGESRFTGSLDYMQKWLNCGSRHTVIKALKGLLDKGLIIKVPKEFNSAKTNAYIINRDISTTKKQRKRQVNNSTSAESAPKGAESAHMTENKGAESALVGCRKCTDKSAESAPNNIYNIYNNNDEVKNNSSYSQYDREISYIRSCICKWVVNAKYYNLESPPCIQDLQQIIDSLNLSKSININEWLNSYCESHINDWQKSLAEYVYNQKEK